MDYKKSVMLMLKIEYRTVLADCLALF